MPLIRCRDCEKEISPHAKTCPFCGCPRKRNKSRSVLVSLFLILVTFVASFFLTYYLISNTARDEVGKFFKSLMEEGINFEVESLVSDTNNVPLQNVKNLGYEFYVGEIESPGTTNINDDLKNQITKIAHTAKFPSSRLQDIPIIIINNLAITGSEFITTAAGEMQIPQLDGDFFYIGGMFVTNGNGSRMILINKSTLTKGRLTDVLTHELGHSVAETLTADDWEKYYELRKIPVGTSRKGSRWELSPGEDFAEVYKNVFTGGTVRTIYGYLMPTFPGDLGSCKDVYDNIYTTQVKKYADALCSEAEIKQMGFCWKSSFGSGVTAEQYQEAEDMADMSTEVQGCRLNVLSNPGKYPGDFQLEAPYVSIVGPQTKDFINSVVDRLNGIVTRPSASDKEIEELQKKIQETIEERDRIGAELRALEAGSQ